MLYTNMWITMQILNICPCIYYSYAERMSYILIILSFNLIKSYLKKKNLLCLCVHAWNTKIMYCVYVCMVL
jgi:hypothetical protein